MKTNQIRRLILSACAASAWLWAAPPARAQSDIALTFDTEDTVAGWSHWWGKPTWVLEFDPTMDAGANPDSGALKVTVNFDVAANGGDNQFCFLFNLPAAVDGTKYATLSMDVYVDPGAPQRPWGDFGTMEFGIRHGDWSQNYFGNTNLATTPGWLHLEAPVSTTAKDPAITNVAGLSFKMWSGDATWGQTGTYIFWVDNVKLTLVPPPPVGTNIVNLFDDASEISQWTRWWGFTPVIEFDPAMDANTNSASGSMKLTVNFDASSSDNQFCVHREWGWGDGGPRTVDGTLYTNIEMDVFVDASSPKRSYGDFGYMEFGLQYKNWSQHYFANQTIPGTAANWVHITAPLPMTDDLIGSISGLTFKMWSGGAPGGQTGTYIFWVDNIKLVAKGSNAPPVVVRPTMGMEPVGAYGLHLIASAPDQQWQRQSIRTVTPNCGWMGKAMEFSMTIDQFPSTNNLGFQAHFILIPTAGTLSTESAPDWSQANCVLLTITRSADGSGWAGFHYKTNQPSGNSMLWNSNPANGPVGSLGGVWSSKVEGTWTVKFEEPNLTMTGPSGAEQVIVMPPDLIELFGDPLYAYFGVQPNRLSNIGQEAVFSRITIRSSAADFTPIDSDLVATALDPTIWERAAAAPASILQISDASAFWLTWTMPDQGFKVQWSPAIEGEWVTPDPALPTPIVLNSVRWVLVPKEGLLMPNCFFRLIKP